MKIRKTKRKFKKRDFLILRSEKNQRRELNDFSGKEKNIDHFYTRNSRFTSPLPPAKYGFGPLLRKLEKKLILNPYSAVFYFLLIFVLVQGTFPVFSFQFKNKVWQTAADWQEWQVDNLSITENGNLVLAQYVEDEPDIEVLSENNDIAGDIQIEDGQIFPSGDESLEDDETGSMGEQISEDEDSAGDDLDDDPGAETEDILSDLQQESPDEQSPDEESPDEQAPDEEITQDEETAPDEETVPDEESDIQNGQTDYILGESSGDGLTETENDDIQNNPLPDDLANQPDEAADDNSEEIQDLSQIMDDLSVEKNDTPEDDSESENSAGDISEIIEDGVGGPEISLDYDDEILVEPPKQPAQLYQIQGSAQIYYEPEQGINQVWKDYKAKIKGSDEENRVDFTFSADNVFYTQDMSQLPVSPGIYIRANFFGTGQKTPLLGSFKIFYRDENSDEAPAEENLNLTGQEKKKFDRFSSKKLNNVQLSPEKKQQRKAKLTNKKVAPEEVIEKRNLFSRSFAVKQGSRKFNKGKVKTKLNDSSFRTEIFRYPVNYQDEEGAWQIIENDFEQIDLKDLDGKLDSGQEQDSDSQTDSNSESSQNNDNDSETANESEENAESEADFIFATLDNNWQTFFPNLASQPHRIQYQDRIIEYRIVGADQNSVARVESNKITYPEVFENVDFVYTIDNERVKEDIIVKSPVELDISYQMNVANVYFVRAEDGSINFYDQTTDDKIFSLQKPYVTDFIGQKADLDLEVEKAGENSYLIRLLNTTGVELDDPRIVYPIIIDPTTTIYAAGTNIYVDGDVWTNGTGSYTYFDVTLAAARSGFYGTNQYRSFFDFDTSGIDDDVTITDVVLKVYVAATAGGTLSVNAMAQQVGFTSSTPVVVYTDAGDGTVYYTGTPTASAYNNLDLGTTADSDLQTNLASNWFGVGATTTTGLTSINTSGMASNKPYLDVAWTYTDCVDLTIGEDTSLAEDLTCTGTITVNNGATLTVSGARTITANALTLDNGDITNSGSGEQSTTTLAITSAITLSNSSDITSNLNVTAATLTLNSGTTISANSKGYPSNTGPGTRGTGAGGGYGGKGGATGSATAGSMWGKSSDPENLGSGGGLGSAGLLGGVGGGLIIMDISGTFTLSGTVSANGGNGATFGSATGGGGGSGGGINITAGTLEGDGTITANGGNGGASTNFAGSGGGGGRIFVNYDTSTFSNETGATTNGGTGGGGGGTNGSTGEDGTIGFFDATSNDINIYEGWQWQEGEDLDFRNVTIANAPKIRTTSTADITLTGNLTVSTSTWEIYSGLYPEIKADNLRINNSDITNNGTGEKSTTTLNITNDITISTNSTTTSNLDITAASMTIEDTVHLIADGLGYNSEAGLGAGTSGSGGGYGAAGGASGDGDAGGTTYGEAATPTFLGSGGSNGTVLGGYGGGGGGMIYIKVTGSFIHNGTISSKGNDGTASTADGGGGGSGGTVFIKTGDTMLGAGNIFARGGSGGSSSGAQGGGGGGGGRIATRQCTNSFTGTKSATGGAGGSPSGVAGSDADVNNNDTFCPPSSNFNSASQKSDGSGDADLSFTVDDQDDSNVKMKIEYTSDANCETGWSDPTLVGPVSVAYGSAPDLDNGNAYQVGTVTGVSTSSGVNDPVQFDWDSDTDLPAGNVTYCLRVTGNDGTDDQIRPSTITLTVDNVNPTVSSLAISTPAAADYNDGVDDWYDQGQYAQMAFTSTPADTNLSSCDWTWNHSDGTSYDYSDTNVEIGTDGDITTANMSDGVIDLSDDTDGTVTLTVTCSDSYGNSGNSNISFKFDNTSASGLADLAVNAIDDTTATLGWTAASSVSNFDHYEIWYGTNETDVANRNGTAAEWDNDDDGNLTTISTTSTTITGLTTGQTYYFKIWAADEASLNNEATATGTSGYTSSNTAPTGVFTVSSLPTQKTDGSGYVDISITVDDADDNDTMAKIEYDTDGTCDGPWLDPTILGLATATYSDSGGVPDVNNANDYQIGTTASTRIITSSGANTVTFDWDSKTDQASADGTYCLRLTVNDDTADQAVPATQTVTVDNVNPTVSSLAISTPAAADYNDGADDWYDQGDYAQMAFSSTPADTNLSSCDWTWNHSDGASYDYSDTNFEIGTDGDISAANMVSGGIDLSDDADGTVTLTVTCADAYGNSGNTNISFKFDNTAPTGLAGLAAAADGDTAVDLTWTAAAESNFGHYEIWYGTNQSDVNGRSGTATEWDNSDDAALATAATVTTNISGLNNSSTYYFKIWAVDDLVNEATLDSISFAFSVCGDGVAEGSEQCDASDLNSQSCETLGQGFIGGTLACSGSCTYDTTGCTSSQGCTTCGNDDNDDDTAFVISSVEVGQITGSSAQISWLTNIDSDSYVYYGLTPAYELGFYYINELTQNHSVTLGDLQPTTTYYYKVYSVAGSDSDESNGSVFATAQCSAGEHLICGQTEVGLCTFGWRDCVSGYWGECSAVLPAAEICGSGEDEDCDGFIDLDDSDCACISGTIETCGETDIGLCEFGQRTCQDGQWGECSAVLPAAEICGNGEDEDCDGLSDEGCPVCVPGSLQECGLTDVGECAMGIRYCGEDGIWGLDCVNAVYPVPEVCDDFKDNDCDGFIDIEDDECEVCSPGSITECGTDIGICRQGERTCQENGVWGVCYGAIYPAEEVCNDEMDNDCDGDTDENCCQPVWQCYDWSECKDNRQVRICIDINSCGVSEGMPETIRDCDVCTPNWTCGWSGECIGGVEDLVCVDLNECNKQEEAPVDHRACSVCGDGTCELEETYDNCNIDCPQQECKISCPNSCYTVDAGECTCIVQSACCGNLVCEENENYNTCPDDCTVKQKECGDGIDNDNDGRIDFPEDEGCSDDKDGSEASFKEMILNAGDKSKDLIGFSGAILNAAKNALKPVQNFTDNPEVEKVSERVVAPAAVALGSAAAMSAVNFTSVLAYLQYVITQPFYLFARRRRKKWGVVYNSVTKKPVDLAIVRLYDRTSNRLIRSRVTDKEGRYNFLIPPGYYYLTITKPDHIYPSAVLRQKKQDMQYLDIYHGEVIDVIDKDVLITANVPIDPVSAVETPKEVIRKRRIKKLQSGLAFGSVPLSLIPLMIIPSSTTLTLFGVQSALFLLFRKLAVAAKPKGWGIVYDLHSKSPLKNAVMRIFDKKYNKLLETQVTDNRGRYSFLTTGEDYYIVAEKDGYNKFQTDIPAIKETGQGKIQESEKVVSLDIGLEKQPGQDVS
ncbi:hypothetical protein C4569_01860 [Candidatus Parcubacteria bacterium]|nr:MAG: hypothetical protein C4569_01860 [Candidatus Parcubacteria bacterium]